MCAKLLGQVFKEADTVVNRPSATQREVHENLPTSVGTGSDLIYMIDALLETGNLSLSTEQSEPHVTLRLVEARPPLHGFHCIYPYLKSLVQSFR